MAETRPEESQCFVLLLAIHNKDIEMLSYFWNRHAYCWDNFHLEYLLEQIGKQEFSAALEMVIES